jgi:predicted acylesterase/phospholipase RssA
MNFLPGEKFDALRAKESEVIKAKREKCKSQDDLSTRFGIALSGGGIRSATLNTGILRILNKCSVLRLADYLSTVSGGGYIGGYVHSKLKENESAADPYETLFSDKDIGRLLDYGYYLAPGNGIRGSFNALRIWGSFLFSLLMNWIWVFSLFFTIYFAAQCIVSLPGGKFWIVGRDVLTALVVLTIGIHFFLHFLRYLKVWSFDALYFVETILFVGIILCVIFIITGCRPAALPFCYLKLSLAVLIFTGFFANPNILTMHRFYRDRLAQAYLRTAGEDCSAMRLSGLKPDKSGWGLAPYPLINTCLNALGREDTNFKGTKTCDYFLMSPFYCGSMLTGYTETDGAGYSGMTLTTAVAVSGAAVNPAMGLNSNKILAFFMTLLNLRLGYWALNPRGVNLFRALFTWWPYYNVLELCCKSSTTKWRVNVTDGGHIENLGIYELLRRRCKLIIAIDAGADPKYSFSDLENLVIRARGELGIAIKFREGLDPEAVIRPRPSDGFSFSHFSVADVYELPGHKKEDGTEETEEKHIGLLVYVKSSMRENRKYKDVKESSGYGYKMYHPSFPHESTVNQFFDEAQWKAYYDLGRFIAGELLRVDVTNEEQAVCSENTIQKLYERFDGIHNKTDMENYINYM